ncbi:MAG: M23 family metallopeptidase [Methylococcaceae bacterium]|nr:M23 family metallopeptidase [Methylococcaceae bacterium]
MLISSSAESKKLYKYQDEQGAWHYTDKPPTTERPVEVRQLKAAAKQRVWLEKSGDKTSPEFFILNQYPGPIEVAVDWAGHDNVIATPELPRRFVVETGKSDTLFKIKGAGQAQSSQFTLQYHYVIGRPLTGYASDTVYLPPIAANSRFQITQAFGGEFSHTDAQNRYAVDIMMPVDTPLYAARGGVVLEVESDYFGNGTEQAYATKANSIRILHDDGSMAVYAHLALEKALVHPGMRVEAGQLIAYSGNTGLTTGPHLHFAVQVNQGMELVSVPFTFADQNRQPIEPKSGVWLEGYGGKGG